MGVSIIFIVPCALLFWYNNYLSSDSQMARVLQIWTVDE